MHIIVYPWSLYSLIMLVKGDLACWFMYAFPCSDSCEIQYEMRILGCLMDPISLPGSFVFYRNNPEHNQHLLVLL